MNGTQPHDDMGDSGRLLGKEVSAAAFDDRWECKGDASEGLASSKIAFISFRFRFLKGLRAVDDSRKQLELEFSRLLDDSGHDLFRYLLMLVPNHADARDLMQETATALWEKFGQFDRSRPFFTWARQFAYLEVMRYRRKQSQTSWKLLGLSDETLDTLADEIDNHQAVLELRSVAMETCIEKLPTDDAYLLRQRYWQQTNLRALALETGVEEHKLYRRLDRIRVRLRKCIEATVAEMEEER